MNSIIKDTNHFLWKIKEFGSTSGRKYYLHYCWSLLKLRKLFDARAEKKVTSENLVALAEIALEYNIFQFNEKTLKQLRGTTICTKFAPPHAIIFMADLEKRIFADIELQSHLWWMYIDDIFFI